MLGYVVSALLGILDLHHVQDASRSLFLICCILVGRLFVFGHCHHDDLLNLTPYWKALVIHTVRGAAVRREITHKHLSGAISVDGIGSIVAPLLNGFP